MPTYTALLRAINVGKRRVKMAVLQEIVAEIGATHVRTVLASGNVVFDHPSSDEASLTDALQTHFAERLGYEVPTVLRACGALLAIQALAEDIEGTTTYVAFLTSPLTDAAHLRVVEASSHNDAFTPLDTEVVWHCRTRLSDSPWSGAKLEKLFGTTATVRKVDTVHKLAAIVRERTA